MCDARLTTELVYEPGGEGAEIRYQEEVPCGHFEGFTISIALIDRSVPSGEISSFFAEISADFSELWEIPDIQYVRA